MEHGSTSPDSQARQDAGSASSSEPSVADAPEDAVEHGGDHVAIRVGPLDDGFYVADDGPGGTPADRDDVFEPGYTTDDEGTGFGLSIVAEIVEAHGWDVAVVDDAAESDRDDESRESDRDRENDSATGPGSGGARFEITGVDWV